MVNVNPFLIIALVSYINVGKVNSLNILGIFPASIKSHFFVFQPYLQELASRGHNVTVISYFANNNPTENYHDIDLSELAPIPDLKLPVQRSLVTTFLGISIFHVLTGPYSCINLLSDTNVQDLWIKQQRFDVIVVEQCDSDCGLALAYKLGAPVVGVTSHMLLPWHHKRLGVPYNPSYVLFDFYEGGTKPTLIQRVQRFLWYNHFNFLNKYVTQKLEQNIVAEYLDNIPPLEELGGNIKFMLLYQNFVLTGSSLLPAHIKEVGGYHIKKPTPLPNDLKEFIEESKHGIIYISFGSNIRASSLPKRKIEDIMAALDELPQRVIWKFESKLLPGNPKNIYHSKWLPQNDILAHPNVVAFFSHCGLLGTTEAIYHGVPIVGMPIIADQPANAAAIEEAGFGVQIHLNDLTKEVLLDKLKSVLDPKFKQRVKLLSKAWHDRPISAMDSAIFWTEFAARHNISTKPRSAEVPLYQYLCLDTFAVLSLITLTVILSFKCLFSLSCDLRSNLKSKYE